MGLFKPYDAPAAPEDKNSPTPASAKNTAAAPGTNKAPTKKTIPTPTRRQAEADRRNRIQPVLTRKESKNREREARYKSRDEAMVKTHARPHNVLIRDWIDHRWNLAEFILPLILVFFVLTIVAGYVWPTFMVISTYLIWVIFAALILDVGLMWYGLRKQLLTHFPDEPLKGKFSYAFSRSMMMRRSRQPPPRVKRGSKFAWPYEEQNR